MRWRRIISLIVILAFFVLSVGHALTFTTLLGYTRTTKDTIYMLRWKLLPMAFTRIVRLVCPGYVSSLSTSTVQIWSPNRFDAIPDFFHHRKRSNKSSPFPFLHSTWRAFDSNSSFLLLNFFFEYTSHGTLPYRTQLCYASGLNFLGSPCIKFCAEPCPQYFLWTVDKKPSP